MKDFDKLLEEENVSLNIEKQIKRKMNKSIYTRVILVLLCIALIGIVLYKGSSKIQEVAHYNPKEETQFLADDVKGNEFRALMSTFIRLNYPGYALMVNDNLAEKDFGVYEYYAKLHDIFQPLISDGAKDLLLRIQLSQLEIEYQPISKNYLTIYIDEFKKPDTKEFIQVSSLDSIKKDVLDLPDSAYINASISFENYISLEDVSRLIHKYPDTRFVWLAIASENQRSPQVAEGMSLYDASAWDFNEEALQKYPHYYIWDNDKITADLLYQKYLSNMRMLIDHPGFVDLMNSYFGGLCPKDRLQERYEEAKKGVKGYGLRVNLTKGDLLKLMDNEDLSNVRIHDVKISKWAK